MRHRLLRLIGGAALLFAGSQPSFATDLRGYFTDPYGSYRPACADYADSVEAACPKAAGVGPLANLFQQTRIIIREKRAIDTGEECNYVWYRVRCE